MLTLDPHLGPSPWTLTLDPSLIWQVTGLQLVDVLTEQVHEVGALADVFVVQHLPGEGEI